MPPKPKFSEEKIVKTAYKIIKKEGLNSLTARKLGEKLESSARPIFTVFKNMDDVKEKVRAKAVKEFSKLLTEDEICTFKEMAVKTVLYAQMEPELFKLIFMWENSEEQTNKAICNLNGIKDTYINIIIEQYNALSNEAEDIFNQAWIHIFGMATLNAGKILPLGEDEIINKVSADIESIISSYHFSYNDIASLEIEESDTEEYDEWYEPPVYEVEEKIEEESEKKKKERIFSWLD